MGEISVSGMALGLSTGKTFFVPLVFTILIQAPGAVALKVAMQAMATQKVIEGRGAGTARSGNVPAPDNDEAFTGDKAFPYQPAEDSDSDVSG